jgi:hypothetical protein
MSSREAAFPSPPRHCTRWQESPATVSLCCCFLGGAWLAAWQVAFAPNRGVCVFFFGGGGGDGTSLRAVSPQPLPLPQADWQRTITSKHRMMLITRFQPQDAALETFEPDEQFETMSLRHGAPLTASAPPTLVAMRQLDPSQFLSLFDPGLVDSNTLPLVLVDCFSMRTSGEGMGLEDVSVAVDAGPGLPGSGGGRRGSTPRSVPRLPSWLRPPPPGVHVVVFQNGLNVRGAARWRPCVWSLFCVHVCGPQERVGVGPTCRCCGLVGGHAVRFCWCVCEWELHASGSCP